MVDHIRYVAHIDILGFTKMVDKDAELAWTVLSGLAFAGDHVHNLAAEFPESNSRIPFDQQIYSVMFSDTIVLFTVGNTKIDLQLILMATSELLHKAMVAGVPVRAGLAHGTFFCNTEKSMYAGPALIEAYRLGEIAQWLGISTSEDVYRRAKLANIQSGVADIVIPACIPTKLGPKAGYAVNWPSVYAHDLKVKLPIAARLFYSQFVKVFGPFEGLQELDQKKYINTVEFINACLGHPTE